jgi:hypothetical protein
VSGARGAVRADLRPPRAPLVATRERRPAVRRRRALFALICAVVLCELLVIAAVGTLRTHGADTPDARASQTTVREASARTSATAVRGASALPAAVGRGPAGP